ncbi:hypothetical protein MKX03_006171 [Papaver bracteatum]|nr:hypothetical protein MKX03_006171 [Papaver bracteatum]
MESNETPRDVILSQYRHMMHISSFGGVNMMWSPGGRTAACFDLLTSAYTGDLNLFRRIALSFDDKGDGLAKTIERLVDGDGRGSLAFAAAGGRVDVCRYLLEELSITINVKDQHDATPLSYGAIRGHLETVRYLLEQGADVDGGLGSLVKYFSAKPPLHYALLGGNAMILELLLNNGATISASALPYAALLGQVDAVRVLLANNADPDGLADATSPLVATIISNSVDIINMLLKAKARKNEQSRGLFPLTFAAHYGRTELVTSLLRAKANTSVTDKVWIPNT